MGLWDETELRALLGSPDARSICSTYFSTETRFTPMPVLQLPSADLYDDMLFIRQLKEAGIIELNSAKRQFFNADLLAREVADKGVEEEVQTIETVRAEIASPSPAFSSAPLTRTTGEAPGTNRLEICGSRGKLVLENETLSFTRNEADMFEFSRTARLGFAKPEVWVADIPFENAPNPHAMLIQNFVNAILEGEPLIAPGEEGVHSVELANSILYSSLTGQTIDLPLDSAALVDPAVTATLPSTVVAATEGRVVLLALTSGRETVLSR